MDKMGTIHTKIVNTLKRFNKAVIIPVSPLYMFNGTPGLTFWPKIIINDNLMLDYVDAFNLIQYSKDKIQDDSKAETSQLNEAIKQLSETSNPVLIILRNK